jgi:hypothetical protein
MGECGCKCNYCWQGKQIQRRMDEDDEKAAEHERLTALREQKEEDKETG